MASGAFQKLIPERNDLKIIISFTPYCGSRGCCFSAAIGVIFPQSSLQQLEFQALI
jgi:hypothetical protein